MRNTIFINGKSTSNIRYVLELDNAAMGSPQIGWRRFVCEDGKAWDGSWIVLHISEAKLWKTEAGALRWLAQRECIKANVRKVTIRKCFRRVEVQEAV